MAEVPDPRPAEGEILVKVSATTVNRTDCAYRAARPFFMRAVAGLRRPKWEVLGTEYAGEVVGVPGRRTRFAVGDRVFGYCEGRFGAHAELLTVAVDSSVTTVPCGVSLHTASAATEGGHYARSMLRRAGVGSADRVLVNGATGGIGSAAVQLAAAAGARVTGVCGPEHLDLVRDLGAIEVIDRTAEDFTRRGSRYDVGRGRRVVFPFPDGGVEMVEEIRGLLASGTFRPVIDRTYPLERISEAYSYVETGQKIGNVVITVTDT